MRVVLSREILVRLLELQARAIDAGFRKPTYGDLISAAIMRLDTDQVVDVLGRNGS